MDRNTYSIGTYNRENERERNNTLAPSGLTRVNYTCAAVIHCIWNGGLCGLFSYRIPL